MKNEFTRGNSTFISTALAAELTGYSQDYISQLARDESVSSTKVSNRWFVDRDELLQHAEANKKDFHFKNVPVMHRSEHFIPTAEAADLSGYSTDYIAELARDGRIESGKEGGRWFVHRDQILTYAQEHKKRLSSRDSSADSETSDTKQKSVLTKVSTETVKEKSDRPTARWRKTRDGLKAIGDKLPTKSISRLPAAAMAFMLAVILGIGGLGMANMSITDSDQQLANIQTIHDQQEQDTKETLTTALEEARYSASMAAAAVSSLGDFLSRPIKNFFVDTLYYGVAGLLQLGDFLVADGELYTAPSITYTQTDSSDTDTPSQPITPPTPGSAGSLTYVTTSTNTAKPNVGFTSGATIIQSVTRLAGMVSTLANRIDSEPSNEVSAVVRDYVADQIADVADLARANVEANLYSLPRNINLEGIEIENLTKTNRLSVTATTSIDGSTFFVAAANNRVGIGTSAPQYALDVSGDFGVTGTTTFSGPANFATTTIDNLTVTNSSTTNATTTNSYIRDLLGDNSTTTNAYITDLLGDNATLTNLEGTNATITNATTTNFFATLANFTQAFFDTLTATVATITNLNADNATTTNLVATEANTTNLTASGTTNLQTTAISNLNVSGTATTSNLVVTDDATFGDTVTDSFAVNSTIGSNLVPNSNATYNLGSPSFYWDVAYIDTINANNLSAASSSISGTAAEDFTINSDNSSVDAERASIIFYRGQVTPNAVFSWDNVADRFDFNQPALFWNEAASTTIPTLTVQGTAGQTADLFQVASSTGAVLVSVTADGTIEAPAASTTNLIATNATTTNAYITTLTADDATLTNLEGTNATITNATTTNFFASLANFTTAFFDTLTATVATITNLTVTNSTTTNATSTNLFAASANFTSAIINTLTATIANFTNLTADNATTTNLVATDANTTNFTASGTTNLATTTITGILDVGFTQGSILFEGASGITEDNTNFFWDGANNRLGIGTDSPTKRLDVSGDIRATGDGSGVNLDLGQTGIYPQKITMANGFSVFEATSADLIQLNVGGWNRFVIPNGDVGIGTVSPNNKFTVDGNADFTGKVGIGTTTPAVSLAIDSTDAILLPVGTTAQRPTGATGYIRFNTTSNEFEGFSSGNWGSLGGGVIDTDEDTYITAEESADEDYLRFYTAGSERLTIDNAGKVGIGTDSPTATLTVAGDIIGNLDGSSTNDFIFGSDQTGYVGGSNKESRFFFDSSKSAFRAGATYSSQWDDANVGTSSVAFGRDTTASGIYSAAMGIGSSASGAGATAFGWYTSASAAVSTAFGESTTASGAYSTVFGRHIEAAGDYSFAVALDGNQSGVSVPNNTAAFMGGKVGIGTTTPAVSLAIDSTDAVLLPVGTTAQRPTGATGYIRYNTSTNDVEVFSGGTWGSLGGGGVIDADQDTYITAEESADEDFLRFYTAGSERMTIDNTGKVGVGTASPVSLLEIKGSVSNTPRLTINESANVGASSWGIDFTRTYDTGGDNQDAGYIHVVRNGGANQRGMVFGIGNQDTVTEKMVIQSDGNVGIGDTTPGAALEVEGSIIYSGTLTDDSDRRLKENLEEINNSLEKIKSLNGYSYSMIGEDSRQYGLIAQDVQKVFPEAVSIVDEETGYLGLDYTQMVAPMIEGIKELDQEVQELAANRFWEEEMNGEKPAENFLAAVRIALEDFTGDVRARFKDVIAERSLEAGERICIDGECITKSQLSALIDLSNNSTNTNNEGSGGMDSLEPRGEEDDTTSSTTNESSGDDTTTTTDESTSTSSDPIEEDSANDESATTTATTTDTSTEDEETATTSDSDTTTSSDTTDDTSNTDTEENTTTTDEATNTTTTDNETDTATSTEV